MSDSFKIPHRDLFVAEVRVLGFRRAVADHAYWLWCMFWLGFPDMLWSLRHVPGLAGCRGYFEWRDGNEFPALSRFARLRWQRWKRIRYA